MEKSKPIYSTREEEPEMHEEISDFVIRLAERIDSLQDLHSGADFDTLAHRSRCLSEQAGELGYPMFADAACLVAQACAIDEPETAEQGLLEMAELARRIRDAHRGAA
jgi:hypothetical protein